MNSDGIPFCEGRRLGDVRDIFEESRRIFRELGSHRLRGSNTEFLISFQAVEILCPCRAEWVSLGGLPHNGKVFGFYDATDQALDSFTPPFNKKFLSFITKQRIEAHQAPIDAFTKYRKTCDPGGLFYTQYLRDLLEGSVACGRQRWT